MACKLCWISGLPDHLGALSKTNPNSTAQSCTCQLKACRRMNGKCTECYWGGQKQVKPIAYSLVGLLVAYRSPWAHTSDADGISLEKKENQGEDLGANHCHWDPPPQVSPNCPLPFPSSLWTSCSQPTPSDALPCLPWLGWAIGVSREPLAVSLAASSHLAVAHYFWQYCIVYGSGRSQGLVHQPQKAMPKSHNKPRVISWLWFLDILKIISESRSWMAIGSLWP